MTHPSFKILGFHLDLRVQVIRPQAVLELIDTLADRGLNLLIIEWEASYPYANHATLSNRYAYSPEEVDRIVAHAESRGMEVVPLQQCFGHLEYILRYPRYAYLRESETDLSQLCPCRADKALPLFRELFEDLIERHPGKYLHIGGDETRLLGHCPECSAVAKDKGISYLYVEYLRQVLEMVLALGKIPVLWADILLKHPECAHRLSKKAVFIDWNYGWAIDRFGDSQPLIDQGFTFWGAPALRSSPDNYWLTCWKKHFNNLRDFIPVCRKRGYTGIIMTSWSTSGQYGYFCDCEDRVAEILPWRRVYPLSGFRMLIDAYAEALHSESVFQPVDFLKQYGSIRFGLPRDQCSTFASILMKNRLHLANGSPHVREIEEARSDCRAMESLTPLHHPIEWQHLVLIMRLQAHFMEFESVESSANASDFRWANREAALDRLSPLLLEAAEMDAHFRSLQKDYLHSSEIEEEIRYRRYRLDDLKARLTGSEIN